MPKLTPEQAKRFRREQLETAIARITAELKGPMSDLDRAMFVADRKDLRAELAMLNEDSNV